MLWSAEALRRTLANHMLYAGYVSVGRAYRDADHELLKGSHAPLLPEALLAPIAAAFAAYTKSTAPRVALAYPLSGLVYCALCGDRLQAQSAPRYRGYKHPLRCAAGGPNARSARVLEQAARDRLQAALGRAGGALAQATADSVVDQLAASAGPSTAAEQRRVDIALANLQELFTWGDIDAATYHARKAALHAARPATSAASPDSAAVQALLPPLADTAAELPPREFAAALRLLYQRINVGGQAGVEFVAREWCAGWA